MTTNVGRKLTVAAMKGREYGFEVARSYLIAVAFRPRFNQTGQDTETLADGEFLF